MLLAVHGGQNGPTRTQSPSRTPSANLCASSSPPLRSTQLSDLAPSSSPRPARTPSKGGRSPRPGQAPGHGRPTRSRDRARAGVVKPGSEAPGPPRPTPWPSAAVQPEAARQASSEPTPYTASAPPRSAPERVPVSKAPQAVRSREHPAGQSASRLPLFRNISNLRRVLTCDPVSSCASDANDLIVAGSNDCWQQ